MTTPARTRRARQVRREATAVGLAVGVYGLSFGALSVASGLTVAQTCALSLLMFTGASQFALVGVVGAGGATASAAAVAWLLGGRNLLYATSLSPLLRLRGARRLVAAQVVIDETTAMATAQPDEELGRRAFLATGVAVYACWNAATLLGALGAAVVPDPRALGLDAAFPAAFLALLAPRLRSPGVLPAALLGGGVAVALTPVVPAGVPVLVAASAVLPVLLVPALRRGSGSGPGDAARAEGRG